MGFAKFMSSNVGRGVRIVAGLVLIAIGLLNPGSILLSIIGAVPLLAGVFDVCLFAPLFGGPLKGAEARAKA